MIHVDTFPKLLPSVKRPPCIGLQAALNRSTLELGLYTLITTAVEKKLKNSFDFYLIFEFKNLKDSTGPRKQ